MPKMSMFRRPTDDSSDSSSTSDESPDGHDAVTSQDLSQAGSEEFIGPDLTATETLSSGESISVGSEQEFGNVQNVEHHRNMILASLLEEFYRTRAVELYKASNPGGSFHRQSPEIQPLAQSLFAQASADLAGAGILPAHAASNNFQNARKQYLVGFDNLGLQNLKDTDLLPAAMKRRISHDNNAIAVMRPTAQQQPFPSGLLDAPLRGLSIHSGNMSLVPHPANDLQLSSTSQRRSHYQSSFHETRLLGKGGFGRVYQTYNFFDQREYAVKKIPLTPKLSQRYRDHGHEELRHILREVQALAQLDHCNVVRYHATWIEEPSQSDRHDVVAALPAKPLPQRKLLDNKPAFDSSADLHQGDAEYDETSTGGDGILFANSHASEAIRMDAGWSHHSNGQQLDQSSMLGSEIFTDGASRRASQELIADDPRCYVLHVQMSMYPMTLTQYLQAGSHDTRRGSMPSNRGHCFHLVPSLKILLGILSGLQYVHAKGLIHRDIKPSNIFLSSYEQNLQCKEPEGFLDVGSCAACEKSTPFYVNPRIGDFGLVADLALGNESTHESSSTSSGKFVGTQFYQPPFKDDDRKNKSARPINEKLDVFALGVILTELLCPCGTNMERLDLLKGLQEGRLRGDMMGSMNLDCPNERSGRLIEELVRGMIEADQTARWSCAQVKGHIHDLLARFDDSSSA